MIHYEHCPVCGSAGILKVITAKDFTVSGESFEIWQCANCSLRFTQDVPDAAAIGRYYKSENYISHTESNKGIVNAMYLQVRKLTLGIKKKLIITSTGVKNGALLDVGAGSGAFVNHMQSAGWKTEGVEPDEQAIKRAAAVYGLQLKSSSELFNYSENSFDAITLWHVLEHVHDLHGYIEQLKRICKPGGRVFVAVPNYTSFDAEHYGAEWAAYDVPRHLYHFSPAAMHALMDKHGCKIESIHPMWFDSFYVSLLSEKYKSGSSNLIKGFWNGLSSNRRAMSNHRRASSIIYVLSQHVK
jgi:2-polyprenyl-3-methyl-5-hydroxy-6-metoxy-1,4-benzoquinol methylase